MSKFYEDAKDLHVSCTVVYVDDGKVYSDADHTNQIQTSDLRNAFKQNLLVYVDGTLCETLAYSESEGIGTVSYSVVSGSSVSAESAVSKLDANPSKNVVLVKAESDTIKMFGAVTGDLQRGVKVNDNKITGTLLNYTETCDLTNYWGTGNFVSLKFECNSSSVIKIEVGFIGSGHSGLSTLDADMDGVWKITDEGRSDPFIVKSTFNDGAVNVQEFDVSGLYLIGIDDVTSENTQEEPAVPITDTVEEPGIG